MNHDLLNDTASLLGQSTQTRRSFLKTSSVAGLGIGFAIASEPVLAQAIKTDFTGIQAGESVIEYGSSKLPIYVARPSQTTKNLPVMLVISEIFGVHEHIADVARRFAKLGYLAIAPEFFYRAGDPQQLGTVAEIQAKIVSQTPDAQVLSDLRATISWAMKEGGSTQKIGINGFCWGGRIVWLACEQIPEIKAGVAWYGRLTGDRTANFPFQPVDLVSVLKAPVLGLYAGKDAGISMSSVNHMQEALKQATKNPAAQASKFIIYPEAGHAFHADYRPSYRKEDANSGWNEAIKWFKERGAV